MNNIIINVTAMLAGVVIGGGIIAILIKNKKIFDIESKKEKAKKIIEESEKSAEKMLNETNEQAKKIKENSKHDQKRREERIEKIRESLKTREEGIKKKEDKINQLKLAIATEKEFFESARNAVKKQEQETYEKLASIIGEKKEDIKEYILKKYKEELKEDFEEKIKNIEENLKENANKKAKKLIVNVIQRLSSPTSVETKSVLIKIQKDFIKGKIIGKNGGNLIEFEKNLEVDIIFNDLPKTISISGFNLINRQIAKKAIEDLIKIRGEINENTIKETIKKAKQKIEKELYEIGERTIKEIGLKIDKNNHDLIKTIGRLQFRTSYGQNIMKHSMEVARVATMLGSELGLNVETCKIGGFLHDLGKAIDQDPDVQGAHDYLTKELMEKHGFKEEEIHAAWTHHESEPPSTPEALMVKAADAVSACRPGAREESIGRYIERLQSLEETAKKFEGVKNTFAISAGRELRIIVDPEKVSDTQIKEMAKNVVSKIEEDLSYPGTIKVKIIRRTHHTEVAK